MGFHLAPQLRRNKVLDVCGPRTECAGAKLFRELQSRTEVPAAAPLSVTGNLSPVMSEEEVSKYSL